MAALREGVDRVAKFRAGAMSRTCGVTGCGCYWCFSPTNDRGPHAGRPAADEVGYIFGRMLSIRISSSECIAFVKAAQCRTMLLFDILTRCSATSKLLQTSDLESRSMQVARRRCRRISVISVRWKILLDRGLPAAASSRRKQREC